MLVVYTCEQAAIAFMDDHGLPGTPRPLANGREFRWLLDALRKPVTRVAFRSANRRPAGASTLGGAGQNAAGRASLGRSLALELSGVRDRPRHRICQHPRLCQRWPAVDRHRFFTTSERACDYLRDAGETGELCELTDLRLTRRFLDRLALEIFAVAVDPVVDDAGRTAKYCFDIATLLEKYLVAAP
jgi:hypothetical protein